MQKIVVCVTGASGSIYAQLLLQQLQEMREQVEKVAVVLSANARQVAEHELSADALDAFPFDYYEANNFNAPFASGSNAYDSVILIPCSMGALGRIATGVSHDLVSRAADVALKERKRLLLVVRETPYSLVHIRNMETVTLAGGIICPATPSFYSKPLTIEDVANTVVHRVLHLAGLKTNSYRWGK